MGEPAKDSLRTYIKPGVPVFIQFPVGLVSLSESIWVRFNSTGTGWWYGNGGNALPAGTGIGDLLVAVRYQREMERN